MDEDVTLYYSKLSSPVSSSSCFFAVASPLLKPLSPSPLMSLAINQPTPSPAKSNIILMPSTSCVPYTVTQKSVAMFHYFAKINVV